MALTSFPLAPLPNVGLSCWFNSALQLMLSSLPLRLVIQRGKGPLHALLNQFVDAVSAKEQHEVVNKHKELYDFVVANSHLFESSQACDAQDCLMWFIEALHKESSKPLPRQVLDRLQDPVSKVICSSYHNAVSSILEHVLSCAVTKDANGQIVRCDPYTILFLEPQPTEEGRHISLQRALQTMEFGHLPTCLFITLMTSSTGLPCAIDHELVIHNQHYTLQSAIFYLRHNSHYVTAIRTVCTAESPYDWVVANDLNLHPLKNSEIDSFLQGYPTVMCYSRVQPQVQK